MAKGTGTFDDPIIVDGLFSKTVNGVKKFFKLNSNSGGSTEYATTSRGQIAWFAQQEVPTGYLVCNGAEINREPYADLFAVIGITFGKGDGINATSKFGTAVLDGEDSNSIRVTVATNVDDATSFDVSTFFKGSLVETQTVKKASELVNNSYVVWDSSVALVAGDDVTFTGGIGSTFNLPDLRDRYIIGANTNALGTQIAEQLPNIKGICNLRISDYIYPLKDSGALKGASGNYNGYAVSNSSFSTNTQIQFNANDSTATYVDNGHVYPLSLALLPCIKY